MDILQVLGIVAVGTIVAVAATERLLRRRSRAAASRLRARLARRGPPARIHLVRVDGARWTHPARAHGAVRTLRAGGFQDAGTFRIDEIPSFLVAGLVHSRTSALAAVYEHPKVGVWTDVAIEYADGSELAASNVPMGADLDNRPGVTRLVDRTWTVEEVLEQLDEHRGAAPAIPVSVQDFPARFEAAYARDADWRNARGCSAVGGSAPVEPAAAGPGSPADPRLAGDVAGLRDARRLTDELIERFARTGSVPPEEWEQIRDEVIVVHDLMSHEEVAALCAAAVDAASGDPSRLESLRRLDGKPTEILDRLNARLPGSVRLRKLGEVAEPVHASVYLPAGVRVE